MLILGLHTGHNATAVLFEDYHMLAAVHLERLTRKKIDGGRIPIESIDECLSIVGAERNDIGVVVLGRTKLPSRHLMHIGKSRQFIDRNVHRWIFGREKSRSIESILYRTGHSKSLAVLDTSQLIESIRLPAATEVHIYNHHRSHALPTLFHTDWDEALLYTSDGGGDMAFYSHRIFQNGNIQTLFGGDNHLIQQNEVGSLGLAYGYMTRALGFKMNQHEGKLTGLAAHGEPTLYEVLAKHFQVDETGIISSSYESRKSMKRQIFDIAKGVTKEDAAASVQMLLENFTLTAIHRMLSRYPVRRIGLSGGVFANVRLNQRIAEECEVDEVFIYPAMDDSGLAAGGVLEYLLKRDGLSHWLDQRKKLETVYFGRNFDGSADDTFERDRRLKIVSNRPVDTASKLIHQGFIVAIYTGRMEYGPRALGSRSILAAATDASINDTVNNRLERTEFMPFAPVVTEADASKIFDLPSTSNYAARFMTITCRVKAEWRNRIPGVVHVDNTARPQIIQRQWNPLYNDILEEYKKISGIPVLINTSFNAHEEPIINSPIECADALANDRVDYIVTSKAVYGNTRTSLLSVSALKLSVHKNSD